MKTLVVELGIILLDKYKIKVTQAVTGGNSTVYINKKLVDREIPH